MRKMLGSMIALALTASLIGVAWASNGVQTETETSAAITAAGDDTVAARGETDLSVSGSMDASTPTTVDDSTSTSVEDDDGTTVTTVHSTTSTSSDDNEGSTPTTIEDTTSTSADDDGAIVTVSSGLRTYTIAEVGEVTVNVVGNALVLVAVDAPGWEVDVEKAESDRIRIEFRKGSAEAEFELEIDHGGLSVETQSR